MTKDFTRTIFVTSIWILFCVNWASPVTAQKPAAAVEYKTNSLRIFDICFTPKGNAIAVADFNSIKIFRTVTGELLGELKNGHNDQILALAISGDSALLISAGKDSTILVWDLLQNTIKHRITSHHAAITSLDIAPNGKYMVSGDAIGKLIVTDLINGNAVHQFADHKGEISTVKFSRDGKLIAAAGQEELIRIYRFDNYELVTALTAHRNQIRGISFSADGSKLISCGDDRKVFIWKIADNIFSEIRELPRLSPDWILSADLHDDNESFVFGDAAGRVRIHTRYGLNKANLRCPVTKVIFKPWQGIYLHIAVATLGKGIILLSPLQMKSDYD